MARVIKVRRRKMGKTVSYRCGALHLDIGDLVIIQTDRGEDYGEIVSNVEELDDATVDGSIREIKRKAVEHDVATIQDNELKSKEGMQTCRRKVQEYGLSMKLVAVEHSFDRSQMIVYFTAEGRVDFRNLVKDLASVFKIRIELRQIGVRDEAKMLGGYGVCGRSLCCSTFLKEFVPVTVRMAKDQRLPLNPSKISGVCGRLMCCLIYEHATYKELVKMMPREGTMLTLPEGKCRVMDVNILRQSVMVAFEDGRQVELSVDKIPGKFNRIKNKWDDLKHATERDDDELKKLEGIM